MPFKEQLTTLDKIRGLGYGIGYLVKMVVSALADPSFYQTRTADDDRRAELARLLPQQFRAGHLSQFERIIELVNSGKKWGG